MDKLLNDFTGTVRRAVDDYDMILEGDRVAVGVSGGKDSMLLLLALSHLRRFYPGTLSWRPSQWSSASRAWTSRR